MTLWLDQHRNNYRSQCATIHEPLRKGLEGVPGNTTVVRELSEIMKAIKKDYPTLNEKTSLRNWFQIFSELRNKTRGHGALTPAKSASLSSTLATSVNALASKNPIFSLYWIFLHRNMSGKYTVVNLQNESSPPADLKAYLSATDENFSDGVYIWSGKLYSIELVHTDLDCRDFFLPNGDFRDEVLRIAFADFGQPGKRGWTALP